MISDPGLRSFVQEDGSIDPHQYMAVVPRRYGLRARSFSRSDVLDTHDGHFPIGDQPALVAFISKLGPHLNGLYDNGPDDDSSLSTLCMEPDFPPRETRWGRKTGIYLNRAADFFFQYAPRVWIVRIPTAPLADSLAEEAVGELWR